MEVSDARRLKALEDENARLKNLLAEQILDNAILKDVAAKNGDARCEAESGGACLLAIIADTSLSGLRVVRELDAIIRRRGRPDTIVSDNGTELTSMTVLRWCQQTGVKSHPARLALQNCVCTGCEAARRLPIKEPSYIHMFGVACSIPDPRTVQAEVQIPPTQRYFISR